jgi:hypothetical protein
MFKTPVRFLVFSKFCLVRSIEDVEVVLCEGKGSLAGFRLGDRDKGV